MICKCGKKITSEEMEIDSAICGYDNLDFKNEIGCYTCECGIEYDFTFETSIEYLFDEDSLEEVKANTIKKDEINNDSINTTAKF